MINLRKALSMPTPINITIWWNFGRILGVVLGVQIITGFFLSMHYCSRVEQAFSSVRHIVRDVNGGWLFRYVHANVASLFFMCIFCHVGRGIYFGSFLKVGTWITGVCLFLMVMASAFLGYVLPWGQMRFWGATVITNLLSSLPYGTDLVQWVWGGYSVGGATLSRFYSFHFLVPLLVVAVVVIHIVLLHGVGSNNPLGVRGEKIPFHSYFTFKDIVGFLLLSVPIMLTFFAPWLLGEPDNFILANPISTPAHIVPEWYFLFAYAILRSVPNKLGGVVGLAASVGLLLTLPFIRGDLLSISFSPFGKMFFWLFVCSFIILTVAGSWPVEEPYLSTRRIFSLVYFFFFLSHGFSRKCLV